MVKTLWVHLVTGEFGIPCLYKPAAITRELRKLISQYELVKRQSSLLKNHMPAILLFPQLIEAGVEILNPVQTSAAAQGGVRALLSPTLRPPRYPCTYYGNRLPGERYGR